jgi:hypothetical protein
MLWIRPLMPRLVEKILLLVALAAVAVGCKPKIGDDCNISTDCSAAGDRLCDITAPGGYCTIFNCEPGTCPVNEALCIEFGAQRSPIQACFDQQAPSPYARAFCMAKCKKDSDCRSGYVCADVSGSNEWGALRIDTDRGDGACLVPYSANPISANSMGGGPGFGDVCKSVLPSAAGSSGASGASGSSGSAAVGGANDGNAGQGGVADQGGAAGQGG